MQGHLVALEDKTEAAWVSEFVASSQGKAAKYWLGAEFEVTANEWRWEVGPDETLPFYSGRGGGAWCGQLRPGSGAGRRRGRL